MAPPTVRFLSLFVDDLAGAAARLSALLGVVPRADDAPGDAPSPHPYGGAGPIVFDLGTLELALYAASARNGTHSGDLGIGVALDEDGEALDARIAAARARSLGPAVALAGERESGRTMRVAMTPERHFFELTTRR